MDTTTTREQRILVIQAVGRLIAFMNGASAAFYATNFPTLTPQTYCMDGGRKYLRIAAGMEGHGRHVHCFVDALTGDVYKAAGWKAPALNGARFNLLDEESFARLQECWDPNGSYLYKR